MNALLDTLSNLFWIIPLIMTVLTVIALILMAKAMKDRGPLAIPGISIALLILLPLAGATVMQVTGVNLSPLERANDSLVEAASPYLTLGGLSMLAFVVYPIVRRIAVQIGGGSLNSAMRIIGLIMVLNGALLLLSLLFGGITVLDWL